MGLMDKIFGTHSQHELKRIYPIVDRIEALEPEMKALSDAELKDKTREFKERLKADRRYHHASGTYCRDAYR